MLPKTLFAQCYQGTVRADGVEVPAAWVISQGQGVSQGVLLIEGPNAYFITSNASDIKRHMEKTVDVITDLNTCLTQLVTTLTAIGAGMTGPTTAPPPTLAAQLTVISNKITTLGQSAAYLTTFKDQLK